MAHVPLGGASAWMRRLAYLKEAKHNGEPPKEMRNFGAREHVQLRREVVTVMSSTGGSDK